jgi:hypothetical protein
MLDVQQARDKEHLPMIVEQLMASATRNRHGHAEIVVGREPLNAAAHGSERGVVGVRLTATGPLSPAEPSATDPDTKRRTIEEDSTDDENLSNIFSRISKP